MKGPLTSTTSPIDVALNGRQRPEHAKLGEWEATAICGNDISSSCLYVTALALSFAGPIAPICLAMVAGVLWLFRGIYAEVVGALPLNGGAYNALLNTTSKYRASIAACLTLLSYIATAVISGHEAIHYLNSAWRETGHSQLSHNEVLIFSIGLLGVFALLTIKGIGESAKAALIMFTFHVGSLLVLIGFCAFYVFTNGLDLFHLNMAAPPPQPSNYPMLFGFSVALLGISGFESSANFVEEQKQGVFPKTLRNMWITATFFNISICILALCIVPLSEVTNFQSVLLARMGEIAGGSWLSILISLNAGVVLSGAVLTSYVGVTGLMHRMALDRCLPQFFLKTGGFGTRYRIITAFFILSAILVYLADDVTKLAAVYTISFLSVMGLFAYGNMLLKVKRDKLPRDTRVSWFALFVALLAVSVGLIGNVILRIENSKVFVLYFFVALLIVTIMLERTSLLKAGIYVVRSLNAYVAKMNNRLTRAMEQKLDDINSQTVVFFTRGDNIANLNNAMLYVRDNETTNNIKVVVVLNKEQEIPLNIEKDLKFLNQAYPEIKIEFVVERGSFGPELLRELSARWRIPLNFMFIGSPGDKFPHSLSELGGVRLII